ncbi:HAD family hydrolase [Paenibacillus helianthi]|uniref:HAD family hydrolase n=1 Tax=Paenibacillus helianthi TaxID=1349432 RepID=A0ABX3EG96_9BACL|nr:MULTISPECIES: HAD family hydrolase [Paenibacillus]OKP76626.1 HAD family hydrolase [Paenibacillus helianthi]OKP83103.1 HAD family hydrolase [Paenibacillus sp. P32E]
MYQTYIFDLYGTLIDIKTDEEQPGVWERLALHFGYHGLTITGEELQQRFLLERDRQLAAAAQHCEFPDFVMEEVFREVARYLGGNPGQAWLHETVRWLRTLSMIKISLYDGVEEILRHLRSRGKKVFLLSNGQKTFIEAELTMLGILHLFDGVAISSEAGISKPDPLFYRYLTEKYGADLSSAVMIGNDPRTDMTGAAAVGIDSCFIRTASSPADVPVQSTVQIWDGDLRKIPGWNL